MAQSTLTYQFSSPALYNVHFKRISVTKYKLHFQTVFQILFSITVEKLYKKNKKKHLAKVIEIQNAF